MKLSHFATSLLVVAISIIAGTTSARDPEVQGLRRLLERAGGLKNRMLQTLGVDTVVNCYGKNVQMDG